ncbi:hypothetical protein [Candidatus Amarolinea aalborgensis]|uniref:hypothetical protein n=1 Tax=Candidatus Amarolinea aalborgensis TaxID=2249329 RepID=UPI003BFA2DE2
MNTTSSAAAADERSLGPTAGAGQRIAWRSGLAGLILQGAVIATFVFGMLLTASLPSHLARRLENSGPIVMMVLLAAFCALGGALWARTLARISGISERTRLAWAGALAYGPPLVLIVFLLTEGEKYFVEGPGQALMPVHVAFAILFTLAASVLTALLGAALGIARGDGRLAARLALNGGATAGSVFLAADVIQHLLGRHVGGPNAEATATMLTVMLVGNILASVAGSAVIGVLLRRHVSAEPGN